MTTPTLLLEGDVLYNGLVPDIVVHEPWEYDMTGNSTLYTVNDIADSAVALEVSSDSDYNDGKAPDHEVIANQHANIAARLREVSFITPIARFLLLRAAEAHDIAEQAHVHALNYSDRRFPGVSTSEKFAAQASRYAATMSVLTKEL